MFGTNEILWTIISWIIFGFGFRTGNSPEDFTLPSFLLNLLCAIVGAIALSAAYRIFLDKSTADG